MKKDAGNPEPEQTKPVPEEKTEGNKVLAFDLDPNETTSLICGDKIVYLGDMVRKVTLEIQQ